MENSIEPKLKSTIQKLNILGIEVTEYNEWAIIYKEGEYLGFIDITIGGSRKKAKYINIQLRGYFVICYEQHAKIYEREIISVYTKGNKNNVMGRNTHTNIISDITRVEAYNNKILLVKNMTRKWKAGQYELFFINYAGKRVNLTNMTTEYTMLMKTECNNRGKQVFYLMHGFGEVILRITEDLEIKTTSEYNKCLTDFNDKIAMAERKRQLGREVDIEWEL